MSGNPDGPIDYAAERWDAERHAPLRTWVDVWNGTNWSYVPDRAELGSER